MHMHIASVDDAVTVLKFSFTREQALTSVEIKTSAGCNLQYVGLTANSGAAIYMTAGPSGAGKDTLLLGAADVLKQSNNQSVIFLKRHITRDAAKTTKLEIPVGHGDVAHLCLLVTHISTGSHHVSLPC